MSAQQTAVTRASAARAGTSRAAGVTASRTIPAAARPRPTVRTIATPEYNGSIPGVLKNALDWASRPFPENALRNKPVAVVGASTSAYGGIWAQAELRKVLGIIGARVVEGGVAVAHAPERFVDGTLVDPEHREQLGELLRDLAAQVELRVAA